MLPSYLKSTALMSKESGFEADTVKSLGNGVQQAGKIYERPKTSGTGYSDSSGGLKHLSKHAYIESISKVAQR